jgi:transcriptional regulator with XRE-family HTH domain
MNTTKKRKYHELKALKGRIRESDSNYRELARRVGMSPTTLSDKINGYSVFDTEEVNRIVRELHIDPHEIIKFFFPHMLRNATKVMAN